MNFSRIVIVDAASLGIGTTHGTKRADTLGHLDAQYLLDVPTLEQLGLGNIYRRPVFLTLPKVARPLGFYGELQISAASGTQTSGLREMFDFNQPLRTLSVFNYMARHHYTTVIISRFISYLADQDVCTQIQGADDNEAFKKLMIQFQQMDTGLIYLQVPELSYAAHQKDSQGYAARLSLLDKHLEILMSKMTNTDLLIFTSSFANDPTDLKQQITRENLPLLMYTPAIAQGSSLGVHRSTGVIAATIIDNFKIGVTKTLLKQSLLPLIK